MSLLRGQSKSISRRRTVVTAILYNYRLPNLSTYNTIIIIIIKRTCRPIIILYMHSTNLYSSRLTFVPLLLCPLSSGQWMYASRESLSSPRHCLRLKVGCPPPPSRPVHSRSWEVYQTSWPTKQNASGPMFAEQRPDHITITTSNSRQCLANNITSGIRTSPQTNLTNASVASYYHSINIYTNSSTGKSITKASETVFKNMTEYGPQVLRYYTAMILLYNIHYYNTQ